MAPGGQGRAKIRRAADVCGNDHLAAIGQRRAGFAEGGKRFGLGPCGGLFGVDAGAGLGAGVRKDLACGAVHQKLPRRIERGEPLGPEAEDARHAVGAGEDGGMAIGRPHGGGDAGEAVQVGTTQIDGGQLFGKDHCAIRRLRQIGGLLALHLERHEMGGGAQVLGAAGGIGVVHGGNLRGHVGSLRCQRLQRSASGPDAGGDARKPVGILGEACEGGQDVGAGRAHALFRLGPKARGHRSAGILHAGLGLGRRAAQRLRLGVERRLSERMHGAKPVPGADRDALAGAEPDACSGCLWLGFGDGISGRGRFGGGAFKVGRQRGDGLARVLTGAAQAGGLALAHPQHQYLERRGGERLLAVGKKRHLCLEALGNPHHFRDRAGMKPPSTRTMMSRSCTPMSVKRPPEYARDFLDLLVTADAGQESQCHDGRTRQIRRQRRG